MAFFSHISFLHSLSISILVAALCLRYPQRSAAAAAMEAQKSLNTTPPGDMQRRFMWKEMDETMDDIIQGIANGAKLMKEMMDSTFSDSPKSTRFKKHAEIRTPASANAQIVIKAPLKSTRIIKITPSAPKKIIQIVPSKTVHLPRVAKHATSSISASSLENGFNIDEKTLREIEKQEEEKVEATISAVLPNIYKDEIILGQLSDGWTSVVAKNETAESFSTEKPHVVSQLHTSVLSDLDKHSNETSPSASQHHSYEVTENVAEETIQRPRTSLPNGQKLSTRKPNRTKSSTNANSTRNLLTTEYSALTSRETNQQHSRKSSSSIPHSEDNRFTTKTNQRIKTTHKPSTTYKPQTTENYLIRQASGHHRQRLKSSKVVTEFDDSVQESSTARSSSTRGSVKYGDKL